MWCFFSPFPNILLFFFPPLLCSGLCRFFRKFVHVISELCSNLLHFSVLAALSQSIFSPQPRAINGERASTLACSKMEHIPSRARADIFRETRGRV